jgi:mycothiol synthase
MRRKSTPIIAIPRNCRSRYGRAVRWSINTVSELDGPLRAQVRALAERVEHRDGAPPLSDQTLAELSSSTVLHVLASAGDDKLAGYAQLDGRSAEVVAEHAELLPDLLATLESAAPADLLIWSHGRQSPLADALQAHGYEQWRLLHQLRRPLSTDRGASGDGGAKEPRPVPEGVTIRAFVPGKDEDGWLRVNAAAFADHAEQGRWTRDDLAAREAEPWFDPSGFLLAERDGAITGYHWTKIHPDGAGEVYVLGIDPSAQGTGLGAALLDRGIALLASRGCPYVLLYVDDSNRAAMNLYHRSGFDSFDLDIQWRRPR